MQSRVVGPMESWRAGAWRAAREAGGRLAAAWRTGTSTGDTGVNDPESGSSPYMADNGDREEERIARGTGVKEQIARGAAVRRLNNESERVRRAGDVPDRRMTVS